MSSHIKEQLVKFTKRELPLVSPRPGWSPRSLTEPAQNEKAPWSRNRVLSTATESRSHNQTSQPAAPLRKAPWKRLWPRCFGFSRDGGLGRPGGHPDTRRAL